MSTSVICLCVLGHPSVYPFDWNSSICPSIHLFINVIYSSFNPSIHLWFIHLSLSLIDNPPNPSSPFRLLPPSTLNVYEGTNVTLPCLASAEFTTNWTFPTSSNNIVITNQTALSIVDVSRDNTGNYTCQVNETDATVMLNVLGKLRRYLCLSFFCLKSLW